VIYGSFVNLGSNPGFVPPWRRFVTNRPRPTGFGSRAPSSTKKSKSGSTGASRCWIVAFDAP
jgi:hypothetical protein